MSRNLAVSCTGHWGNNDTKITAILFWWNLFEIPPTSAAFNPQITPGLTYYVCVAWVTTSYRLINSATGKYCSVAFISFNSPLQYSSTDSKVGTTLHSMKNSTTGKCFSVAFMCILALEANSSQQTQNLIRSTLTIRNCYTSLINEWHSFDRF